jgi:tRNA(Ile)-lysidine synthase
MEIDIKAGKYILAVSGGVDSMVLLDLLAKSPDIELIVAHFNHGIRPESDADETFVAQAAKRYKLSFAAGYGRLGKNASEERARQARYSFLSSVKMEYSADGIITAHHQDDMIESALLNILRGTGYKGLVSIKENKDILRPLLEYSKSDILNYAKSNDLKWREDNSNLDKKYLRNRVRLDITKNLTPEDRRSLISNIDKVAKTNNSRNGEIANLSQYIYKNRTINRLAFTSLPVEVGNELITYWLSQLGISDYDRKMVNRINVYLRTSKPGSLQTVKDKLAVKFDQQTAQFVLSVK